MAEPPGGWDAYADRGGLGSAPGNSQALVEALMADAGAWVSRAAAGGVVVATPPKAGFATNAWRFRLGGIWLGGRTWARRYAVVPADAPLGTLAHELGHLLFGWADHDRRSCPVGDCLMGTGAGATGPPRPCAPPRVEAGWVELGPATRTTMVGDLGDGRVVRSRERLIEAGPNGDVVVYEGSRLVGRVHADPDGRLLAVVASVLR